MMCVFLCLMAGWSQVSGSRWIPTCNPHSICSRTCSHWPSTLLLGPWRIPNSWPRTMKMASRQSAKRWKPCRKTAWSTSFLQVSLASCKYTHLAHVASLYDLTSCSHPFRYVFCIPVSIAVIDSDWRHWQWMMHGAHSMVSGRHSAQSFRAAVLAKMGSTCATGIPSLVKPIFARLHFLSPLGTWRVCYLKCLVVLLRVVRCELQHVCFPVSAGWENSCHPCDHGVGAGISWIKTATGFCQLYIEAYWGKII